MRSENSKCQTLCSGDLRSRLRTLRGHGLACPAGLGILIGDLNLYEPEEGRFNVESQTFSDGESGSLRCLPLHFPTCVGDRASTLHKKGRFRRQGFDRAFINFLMTKTRD